MGIYSSVRKIMNTKISSENPFNQIRLHRRVGDIIRRYSTNQTNIYDRAIAECNLKKPMRILDLGCGYGRFTRALKLSSNSICTGIDTAEKNRDAYLQSVTATGAKGEFILGSADVIQGFPSNSFDLILSSFTLYFFPDLIPDIARILTQDGEFIVITHSGKTLETFHDIVRQTTGFTNRLHIEDVVTSFSAENGFEKLKPNFNAITTEDYPNQLHLPFEKFDDWFSYLDFRLQIVLEEKIVRKNFDAKKFKQKIYEIIEDKSALILDKNDRIFRCKKTDEQKGAMKKERKFCPLCGGNVEKSQIEDRMRDYCRCCDEVFYDNPLPVVSAVIVNKNREVLLVLRDRNPKAGFWCLPSGFAEINETISEAALRELKEETNVNGRVIRLLDAQSHFNDFYGDLIWTTFEVSHISGKPKAGDDARDVKFFPINKLPELAFAPNQKAIEKYLEIYQDLWAMQDSFQRLEGGNEPGTGGMISDSLFDVITRDSHEITENWVSEVTTHPTTRHYAIPPHEETYQKANQVVKRFGRFITHPEEDSEENWNYFRGVGVERRQEGYKLSEVISALSLIRKHLFAHVFGHWELWKKPIEMYRTMEFVSRVNLFYDKATYEISRGYDEAEVIVNYFEMKENPNLPEMKSPLAEVEIVKWENPPVADYRKIYNQVGANWHWSERNFQTDEEIAQIISGRRTLIYHLKVGQEIAGFAEMDLRKLPEIELKHFGLKLRWIGKGLGKYFLNWIVRKAWAMRISRLWLHTASNDHPGAYYLYKKSGFELFKTEKQAC